MLIGRFSPFIGLRRLFLVARLRRLEREVAYMQSVIDRAPLAMAAHRVHINRTLLDLQQLEQRP